MLARPCCPRSGIGPLLNQLRRQFSNGDAFHELLFHLLYEKFTVPANGGTSFWKPYLDIIPTAPEMHIPLMFRWVVLMCCSSVLVV